MPVLDDISHRKKWLNLCWNYLRCNVWGLRLLWVFRASAVCKGLKKILHSLFNLFHLSSERCERKSRAPVLCWCCACVFHKASCVARVNTVTVYFTNAIQSWALIFRTRTQDFWSRKEALFGWPQEIPCLPFPQATRWQHLLDASWMQIWDPSWGSQHLFSGFPVLKSLCKTSFNPAPPWWLGGCN